MSRCQLFTALALLALPGLRVAAEEPTALAEELRALRALVELQSKQIDMLTRQVAKLTTAVEGKTASKPDAEPAPEPPSPPAAAEEGTANAPKAELAGPPKHTVQKGETLTSIAKHYNIPLTDLQKANKDLNPAKLQIGQAVTIPAAPAPKNPEPTPATPEKKETR
jgi:LysM repeat protein